MADKKPGSKKRFISDQDMWDLSLDIDSKDSIDSELRAKGGKDSRDIASRSSRAQSVNLKRPDAGKRPDAIKQPPRHTATQPVRTTREEVRDRQRQEPVPATRNPRTARQTNVQKTTHARPTQTQPVAKQAPQERPHTSTRPINPKNPALKQNTKPQSPKTTPKQTEPAVFTTRDINLDVAPQNYEEVKKIQRKENFLRFASVLWSVFDFFWSGIAGLFKLLVRTTALFYRHKLIVAVSLVSFSLGFVVASVIDADFDNATLSRDATGISPAKAPAKTALKSNKATLKKKPIKSKKTVKNKTTKARVKPPEKVTPKPATPAPATATETPQTKEGKQSTARQFFGKDLLFEEIDIHEEQPMVKPQGQASGEDVSSSVEAEVLGSDIADMEGLSDIAPATAPGITEMERELPMNTNTDSPVPPAKDTRSESKRMEEDPFNGNGLENGRPAGDRASRVDLEALLQDNVRFYQAGDWQNVISVTTRIISIDPTIIDAYINRCVAHTEMGMFDEAIEDADKAIDLDPRNALAINNRGYAYEKAGILDAAIADYQAACNLWTRVSCQETDRLREAIAATE